MFNRIDPPESVDDSLSEHDEGDSEQCDDNPALYRSFLVPDPEAGDVGPAEEFDEADIPF